VQDLRTVERRSLAFDVAKARANKDNMFDGADTYAQLQGMNDCCIKKGAYFLTNRVRTGQLLSIGLPQIEIVALTHVMFSIR
jgi:hypothetical protein